MGDMDIKGEINLSQCEREPIAFIDAIQSGAYLIAFNQFNLDIVAYSENISALKLPDIESHSNLDALFNNDICQQIKGTVSNLPVSSFEYFFNTINDNEYVFSIYRSNQGNMLLVIEPDRYRAPVAEYAKKIQRFSSLLGSNPSLTTEFYNECAFFIQELLEFDRVMVYKFYEDAHGEVVGEAKRTSLAPLLHNHFPASDIPKTARELYKKDKTRLVMDICSDDIPLNYIKGQEKLLLDISATDMRALSPIHKEYLKNMGVTASLSISIIVNDKLWGLIACHNNEAVTVDFTRRRKCEVVANLLSKHISAIEAKTELEYKNYTAYRLRKFQRELLSKELNYVDMTEDDLTLGIIDSDYLIILSKAGINTDLPNITESSLMKLIMATGVSDASPLYATHQLNKLPIKRDDFNTWAGVMIACISEKQQRYVIWIRQSVTKKVTWGGNPTKVVVKGSDKKNEPRASFDNWIEEVKYESEEWSEKDKEFAEDLIITLRLMA